MSRAEQFRAIRCLTPVCARLTTYKTADPVPERCPECAGPVEPFELQRASSTITPPRERP